MTLVEYGSYACPYCHAAHEGVRDLRDRFGERMRSVFRHLPIRSSDAAIPAAELAGELWRAHDLLMRRGPTFAPGDLEAIAVEEGVPPRGDGAAAARVEEDVRSARLSGALVTPSSFIDGRRYEGAWDESALAEAMLGSLGHRLHARPSTSSAGRRRRACSSSPRRSSPSSSRTRPPAPRSRRSGGRPSRSRRGAARSRSRSWTG